MAEADSASCRCTNISIMQLFHQLKQQFPKVPDQIVSKIIQQNYHDKFACETLLQKESTFYMQCYPGALISGDSRPEPQGPISDRCSIGSAEVRNSQLPKCQQAELHRPDADSHSIAKVQQSGADGAAAVVLPTSQKQTICDVKLPLNATHVCAILTPRASPPSLQDCPHENELSTTDSNQTKTDLGDSTATSEDDIPNKTCSPNEYTLPNNRLSHPSLEERLELSKIPLGQLIREAREKVTERENSERKKGCELTLSESEICAVDNPPYPTPESSCSSSDQTSIEQNIPHLKSIDRSDSIVPVISSIGSVPNEIESNRTTLLHCDTSLNGSPAHSLNVLGCNPIPPPPLPLSLENSLNKTQLHSVQPLNRLAPPTVNVPFKSSFRSDNIESNARLSHPSSPSESSISETPNVATQSSKEYEVAVECVVRPAPGDQQRSFTSVNLTLRPPSAESALPIDISSGQSLTYTSESFDPRQGYQSHLQIRIGPAGGSVTACRTRFTSPIVHTSKRSSCNASAVSQSRLQVRALLQQQRERRDMLSRELRKKRDRLRTMQTQVQAMKLALVRAASTPLILSKLKADIERLRGECERLTAAVDFFSDQDNRSNLPLGETDEDFYRNIYTGQRQQRAGWSCRICTFRNHPLLTVCEECEMPRLSLGTTPGHHDQSPASRALSNPVLYNNNSSPCAAGETSTSVSRTITPLQER